MPTVNEPPATPTNRLVTRNCQNSVAREIMKIGMTVDSISTKNTMRPPNLSVHMPNGTRINEPASTCKSAKPLPFLRHFLMNVRARYSMHRRRRLDVHQARDGGMGGKNRGYHQGGTPESMLINCPGRRFSL